MAEKHYDEEPAGLGTAKIEAAAFVLGAPIYTVAMLILTTGLERLVLLALYGLGAGGWVVWRAGRARARSRRQPAG